MKNCVLIIGFGESGKWAYNLALKLGYMPLIFDDTFSDLNYCWIGYGAIDFAIVSPGVPPTHKLIKKLNEKGVKIISEIEFCYLARTDKSPIIGVTGTNGKTTVTEMIASVLGGDAVVAGNIGRTWSEVVTKNQRAKYTLLELSSFQLNNINLFHPKIAVLTNLAPDHIDYHGSYESYKAAKMNIVKNMSAGDYLIYNGEDDEVKSQIKLNNGVRSLYFSEEKKNGEGVYLENGRDVVFCFGGDERKLFSLPNFYEFKKHTILNLLASALVCALVGVHYERIEKVLLNFEPSKFRQSEIKNELGIKIINDSKATNLAASLMAISEHKPNVLLVGGRGKCEEYNKLFNGVCFHDLVVYGEMGEEIIRCARENNFKNIEFCESFDDAVKLAVKLTKSGEILLFSPAGSSFDQFKSYKERGERFDFLIKNMN